MWMSVSCTTISMSFTSATTRPRSAASTSSASRSTSDRIEIAAGFDAREVEQVGDKSGEAARLPSRGVRRTARRSSRSSAASAVAAVSASARIAATGVFSSCETFATKSRRTRSRRYDSERSDSSRTVAPSARGIARARAGFAPGTQSVTSSATASPVVVAWSTSRSRSGWLSRLRHFEHAVLEEHARRRVRVLDASARQDDEHGVGRVGERRFATASLGVRVGQSVERGFVFGGDDRGELRRRHVRRRLRRDGGCEGFERLRVPREDEADERSAGRDRDGRGDERGDPAAELLRDEDRHDGQHRPRRRRGDHGDLRTGGPSHVRHSRAVRQASDEHSVNGR